MLFWSTVTEVVLPSPDVNPDTDPDPQSGSHVRTRRVSGTHLRQTSRQATFSESLSSPDACAPQSTLQAPQSTLQAPQSTLQAESSRPASSTPASSTLASSTPAASRPAIARPIGIEIDDTELARRMITDEAWAKEAFYRKHVEQAYRVARRLVRNPTDAEDIVQEAFSQAFRDIGKLREPAAVRGWFMRIVVNRAHRKFRRRNLLRIFGLDKSSEDSLDRVPSSDLSAESCAELALANRVLEQASLASRTAWLLRHVEGYTLPEAALATDCSLATVKRRITEVNQLLERHLSIPRLSAEAAR